MFRQSDVLFDLENVDAMLGRYCSTGVSDEQYQRGIDLDLERNMLQRYT